MDLCHVDTQFFLSFIFFCKRNSSFPPYLCLYYLFSYIIIFWLYSSSRIPNLVSAPAPAMLTERSQSPEPAKSEAYRFRQSNSAPNAATNSPHSFPAPIPSDRPTPWKETQPEPEPEPASIPHEFSRDHRYSEAEYKSHPTVPSSGPPMPTAPDPSFNSTSGRGQESSAESVPQTFTPDMSDIRTFVMT